MPGSHEPESRVRIRSFADEGERAIGDVLTAHAHEVRAALTGVEQEGERQAGARTDYMPCLELLDLALGPAVIAVSLDPEHLHIARRVVRPHSDLERAASRRAAPYVARSRSLVFRLAPS